MLVCDIPCDECGDVTLPKFTQVYVRYLVGGEIFSANIRIYCPAHNAGHDDTLLMREANE